ncbi:MAG: hypothetical protein Q8L46_00480, partial [candidate division WWE3 bacterium]|nr:hypothetical protein [candidate division WWE3 bacterium]
GLLASVGLAAFTRAQTRGRDAKRIADLAGVRSALELYYAENSNYINTANAWVNASTLGALVPTFIKVLPSDPKTGWSAYRYRSVNSGTPSTAQGYCLAANREVGAASTTCTVTRETNYDYSIGNP